MCLCVCVAVELLVFFIDETLLYLLCAINIVVNYFIDHSQVYFQVLWSFVSVDLSVSIPVFTMFIIITVARRACFFVLAAWLT